MAYSTDVIRRAKERLAQEKARKEATYRRNLQEAYTKLPRLRQIDTLLRSSMVSAARAAFEKGGDLSELERVKQENLALQQEYRELVAANLEPGFLDESPICTHCGGNGYIGSTMCRCLRMLCIREQRKEIAELTTGAERFDAFRLEYYSSTVDRSYGASPRFIMEKTLEACRQYAATFGEKSGNLMFVGGTGLGKTFLSACIANEVTDKGFSVAYESAPSLFAKLEKNRFSPDEESARQAARFTGTELLILDDLGTEMPGSFVTAALYSLVNERLLSGKSTIISTNLNITEIAARYSPQIASRLQGSYKGLTFVGEDIRVQKARGVSD